jgi:hypothetical protein
VPGGIYNASRDADDGFDAVTADVRSGLLMKELK